MMRSLTTAALLTLWPGVASASSWEARAEATDFKMTIGAPGADVCVVFPASLRTAACDGLDLKQYGLEKPNHTVAVVRGDTYGITVELIAIEEPRHEVTAAEAREWHAATKRALETNVPPGATLGVGRMESLRVNGLQTLHMRAEFTATDWAAVQENYSVIGAHGASVVIFQVARKDDAVTAPLIAKMVESVATAPARSVNSRIGSSLLSLLAGAPLVLLAAAVASRKKPE